eukprot:FR736686.1.p2 GENE.FR736686.1~~FR736686.1.p2  ORF type:complete len:171 (-),score=15.29 FR736686.1:181-693(-)
MISPSAQLTLLKGNKSWKLHRGGGRSRTSGSLWTLAVTQKRKSADLNQGNNDVLDKLILLSDKETATLMNEPLSDASLDFFDEIKNWFDQPPADMMDTSPMLSTMPNSSSAWCFDASLLCSRIAQSVGGLSLSDDNDNESPPRIRARSRLRQGLRERARSGSPGIFCRHF